MEKKGSVGSGRTVMSKTHGKYTGFSALSIRYLAKIFSALVNKTV